MSDYIDRQAALNAINIEREYMTRRQEWGAEHILTHYGYRIIADMPSADVAPVRHGRWEWSKEPHGVFAKCTACGKVDLCGITYDMGGKEYKHAYCPNCGARMDGVQDE